jgi:hypothetical protein
MDIMYRRDYTNSIVFDTFGSTWGMSARVIEFLAGWSNYQGFKDYPANRGLENILKNHGLPEECSTTLKSGLLVAAKAVNG